MQNSEIYVINNCKIHNLHHNITNNDLQFVNERK